MSQPLQGSEYKDFFPNSEVKEAVEEAKNAYTRLVDLMDKSPLAERIFNFYLTGRF